MAGVWLSTRAVWEVITHVCVRVLVEEVLHVMQAGLLLEGVDRQVCRIGQQQRGSAFAQKHHLDRQARSRIR